MILSVNRQLSKKIPFYTTEYSAQEYELSTHLVCHNNSCSSNAHAVLLCVGVCCNSPLLRRKGVMRK